MTAGNSQRERQRRQSSIACHKQQQIDCMLASTNYNQLFVKTFSSFFEGFFSFDLPPHHSSVKLFIYL
ncbi:unnamed protein product [Ceratitis capitata]|uniref:(Mediterranean fruit fly) hypothetical protein n=1 Tax=Ceratitis capitata TaxID=7213 RepID=A0A811V642_CERCA|nr:unnamed protein product [Ceratitis capitata]